MLRAYSNHSVSTLCNCSTHDTPDPLPRNRTSPMLLRDQNLIHIHPLHKPPLLIRDLDIIPTHLPLPHPPILRKSPILKTIRPPPLARGIMPLIPELDGNLDQAKPNQHCTHKLTYFQTRSKIYAPSLQTNNEMNKHTLLSVNANNSFLNRYPFSTFHLPSKNATISSVPRMNWSRFLHIESGV